MIILIPIGILYIDPYRLNMWWSYGCQAPSPASPGSPGSPASPASARFTDPGEAEWAGHGGQPVSWGSFKSFIVFWYVVCLDMIWYDMICFDMCWSYKLYTSSTAQGGGGSFKNRKPMVEIGCCDSRMAERMHWWTDRWLELCFLECLQWLQWSPYHNCWM